MDNLDLLSASKTPTLNTQKSKEIADKIANTDNYFSPVLSKKLYITAGIIISLFVIGIVVAVILLTRSSDPAPTPTPTVTASDQHHPHIIPIALSTVVNGKVGSYTSSTVQMTLFVQEGGNIGTLITASSGPVQLITFLTSKPHTVKSKLAFVGAPRNGNISTYSRGSKPFGSTVLLPSGLLNTFELDITNSNIHTPTNVFKEPLTNKPYWVTSVANSAPSDIRGSVLCTFSTNPDDSQFYSVQCFSMEKNLPIPSLSIAKGLIVAGDYKIALLSNNQDFFSILFFNQDFGNIIEMFNGSVANINAPGDNLGTLTHGAVSQNTSVLITLFDNSVWVYTRDITKTRPTFELVDWIFLDYDTFNCAIDVDGKWFAISTRDSAIVVGNLGVSGIINRDKIREISIVNQGSELTNTNGPCGVQLSSDRSQLYVCQSDNSKNIDLFVIPVNEV
jgi:hypothetical protein